MDAIAWYFLPLLIVLSTHWLGIVGSIIGIATPAGGGIIYFPALTLLNVPANQAVAFNYCTACLSMLFIPFPDVRYLFFLDYGFFGTIAWLRKRPDILSEYWWLGCWTTVWGWIGCGMGIYIFPIESEFTLRIMFLIFCVLVFIYVVWMIWSDASGTSEQLIPSFAHSQDLCRKEAMCPKLSTTYLALRLSA